MRLKEAGMNLCQQDQRTQEPRFGQRLSAPGVIGQQPERRP